MAFRRTIDTTQIPSSGTTSPAVSVPSLRALVAIVTPSALTGTSFTFEASTDAGATWVPVYDGGSSYSVAVSTSRYVALKPEVFFGIGLLRLVSGSSEAAARDITLVFAD